MQAEPQPPQYRKRRNGFSAPAYIAVAVVLVLLAAGYMLFGPAFASVGARPTSTPAPTVLAQRPQGVNAPGAQPDAASPTARPAQPAASVEPSGTPEPTRQPTEQPTATPTLTPFTGDPVAPLAGPPLPDPTQPQASVFFTETGHSLAGDFLKYYRANPKARELFGLPLTEAYADQFPDGSVYMVQYFERARFEFHPAAPAGQQVQLGILGPAMLNGQTFQGVQPVQSTVSQVYFPETGHTISNGFLNYWKTNGGLPVFGFPLSEEVGENGIAVQYFERAKFEYYAGLEGTPYAVQLAPAGYYALRTAGLNVPMGTLVRVSPPVVAEGHTAVVQVAASAGMTVTGQYEGRPLIFKEEPDRGVAWALLGAVPFQDVGTRTLTINLQNGDGGNRTVSRNLRVVSYPFPSESLQFDPETAKLLDPAVTQKEADMLAAIFAQRTPEQYWNGTFRMPLDGKIRITSYFATRRCYNCPDGSTPTSYHGGMDMAANVGTPVHAPAAGRIVFAGQLSDRGNAIIIDHGMGVFSLLAHNSKLIATVGQMVQQGDVVSLSGNTGLSNGPHVHWEVHVNGPGVEALEWVKRPLP